MTAFAAFAALSMLMVPATPVLAACSGSDWATTDSFRSTWYGKVAYRDPGTMSTAGAPCVDVNVRQYTYTSTQVRGSYYSASQSTWKHGTAGWVSAPEGMLKVVISNLTGTGVEIRIGSAAPSTTINVLT